MVISSRCGAGGVEFLVALFELNGELDDLVFEVGDTAFELLDVLGDTEPGLGPGQGQAARQAAQAPAHSAMHQRRALRHRRAQPRRPRRGVLRLRTTILGSTEDMASKDDS